jgi:hypothetical protein
MIKEFLEGETYTNSKLDKDVMVLGIGKETQDEVVLAILWVERQSNETTGGDELTVKKSEFSDWTIVEI